MYDDIDIEDVSTWPVGVFTCTNAVCEGSFDPFEMQVPQDPMAHHVVCGLCGHDITKKART